MTHRIRTWGWLGLGAAAGGALAGHFLDRSDLPAEDRTARGLSAGLGLAAGLFLLSSVPSPVWRAGRSSLRRTGWLGWSMLRRYVSNMETRRRAFAGRGLFRSLMHGYGTIGVFAAAGALAGAALDDESRIRGALVGAAAGAGVRTAIRITQGLGKVPSAPFRVLAAAALAAGIGTASSIGLSRFEEFKPEMQDPRFVLPENDPGVGQRLRAMAADGAIVLGAHNLR